MGTVLKFSVKSKMSLKCCESQKTTENVSFHEFRHTALVTRLYSRRKQLR